MLNEVLNARSSRAFRPGRRKWTERGGPFMWCTFSFGWSEGEAAAGTEEGKRNIQLEERDEKKLEWSGPSTCRRALDTWGLAIFTRSHCWPWLLLCSGAFPCWSCLEKCHRSHPPQTISRGTTEGFATGRTVTMVTIVTRATTSATCQQVSADAAAAVWNFLIFLNLREECELYICFPAWHFIHLTCSLNVI